MSYVCEWCEKTHDNEFSRTCPECDFERESGSLEECEECEEFFMPGKKECECEPLSAAAE